MMWLLPSSSKFELTDLCHECVHPTIEHEVPTFDDRLFAT
jgi:hypothetical protein